MSSITLRSAGETLPMHRTLNYSFLMRYLKDLFLVRNRNAFILAQTQEFLDEGIGLLPRLQIKVLLQLFLGSRCQRVPCFLPLQTQTLLFSVFILFCKPVSLQGSDWSPSVHLSSEKNYRDFCPKYNHPGDRLLLTRISSVHSFIALIEIQKWNWEAMSFVVASR